MLNEPVHPFEFITTLTGSVDLEIETKGVLESILKVNADLLLFQQERDELRQKFKVNHPVIIGLDNKIGNLNLEKQRLEARASQLPQTQQKYCSWNVTFRSTRCSIINFLIRYRNYGLQKREL